MKKMEKRELVKTSGGFTVRVSFNGNGVYVHGGGSGVRWGVGK